MTFLTPKGIAVAVVVLSLLVLPFPELFEVRSLVSQLIVMGMIFSLFTSTIVSRFDSFFLKTNSTESKLKQDAEKLALKKKVIEKELKKKEVIIEKITAKEGVAGSKKQKTKT
jgi:hypothetical protein